MGAEKSEMVKAFKTPEGHARLQHFSTRGGQCATPFCNTDDFALIGQTLRRLTTVVRHDFFIDAVAIFLTPVLMKCHMSMTDTLHKKTLRVNFFVVKC